MNKLQKHIYSKLPRIQAFLYKESFSCSREIFNEYIRHTGSLVNLIKNNRTSYVSDPIASSERYLYRLDRKRREERERIANRFKASLKPLTDEKHYGIELELFFELNDDFTAAKDAMSKQNLHEYVQIKTDGSITCSCDRNEDDETDCACITKEFALLVPESKLRAIVTQVTDILNAHGAKVNKSCGLHVHFDMRDKTSRQVALLGTKLGRWVTSLKTMLPSSRRENQYCRIPKNTIRSSQRYACINLQSYSKYKTLEVRMHSGTTDNTKILLWIDLLNIIMSKSLKVPTTWEALELPPYLMLYIQSRIEKFSEIGHNGTIRNQEDNDAPVMLAA